MENQFADGIQRQPRKGMAISSLVLGILSIPTLGLLLIGGVVGLILGIIALRRVNRDPAAYGGKGIAIAGIVTSGASFLFAGMIGVVAAIAIPNVIKSAQAARETVALRVVGEIGQAQRLYSVTKGKGKFGSLDALAAQQLIAPDLATGQRGGYFFESTPINIDGQPPMFDTTARPVSTGTFGTGNRSFYSNEMMVIWEVDGGEPPKATPSDRVPKTGSVVR